MTAIVDDDPVADEPVAPAEEPHLGWGTSRRATVAAWVVFGLVALLVANSVMSHDFRERGIKGDGASFVLQAVSIGFDGHNLSYDRTDLDHFRALRWMCAPRGSSSQRRARKWSRSVRS